MNQENNETKILVAQINGEAERERLAIINHEDGLTKGEELALKREELNEKARQFDEKLKADKEKQEEDARLKEKQIRVQANKNTSKK
jgi:hypothetical protein